MFLLAGGADKEIPDSNSESLALTPVVRDNSATGSLGVGGEYGQVLVGYRSPKTQLSFPAELLVRASCEVLPGFSVL